MKSLTTMVSLVFLLTSPLLISSELNCSLCDQQKDFEWFPPIVSAIAGLVVGILLALFAANIGKKDRERNRMMAYEEQYINCNEKVRAYGYFINISEEPELMRTYFTSNATVPQEIGDIIRDVSSFITGIETMINEAVHSTEGIKYFSTPQNLEGLQKIYHDFTVIEQLDYFEHLRFPHMPHLAKFLKDNE
ncbi:hypothetical protein [Colwellia psychrerythraea]|uniref:Uncharacterized protein n=1 Tax=Colwellia psychrerythraea TaxID=28229 RepID=A0A099KS76_COLPS|nr:hypothetical protein [Colwellia psychrerythraea]KGJ93594.1 hypothetical protein ND2E_2323 [Colwellia psychrerythraea]